jgi:GTP:adenosylcobinamide-phosphate guanylyltransferase
MLSKEHPQAVDAILLGGKDPDAKDFNAQYKYNLLLNGQKILDNVLGAISSSNLVNKLIFVTPESEIAKGDLGKVNKDVYLTEPKGKLWDNLSAGIKRQQQLGGNQQILIICSDLPFLTSKSIDWLVQNSCDKGNICLPTVSRASMERLRGIYETYFWPMKEGPFKFGNNLFTNINLLEESKLPYLINEYRKNQYNNDFSMLINRIGFMCRYGGKEAIYTLFLNYLSKTLQVKIDTKNIPFSSMLSKANYEKLLSEVVGSNTQLLDSPHIEIAMDVDSQNRFEIFRRAYDSIMKIINE